MILAGRPVLSVASALAVVVLELCGQAAAVTRGPVPGPAAAKVTTGGRPLDAALYATGSCIAFGPTRGSRHLTVFLDAGHGGVDPGATGVTEAGRPVDEATETLAVELDALVLLRADGFRVVVSRTGDSTVARMAPGQVDGRMFTVEGEHHDVIARPHCANLARANILIGIYFNASSSSETEGSITAYDASRPFAAASHRLAMLVQRDVLAGLAGAGLAVPNDGVLSDAGLGGVPLTRAASFYDHLLLLGPADPGYFSHPSSMPGALIEPLFVTAPREATQMARPEVQRLIAAGIATAAVQYFAGG